METICSIPLPFFLSLAIPKAQLISITCFSKANMFYKINNLHSFNTHRLLSIMRLFLSLQVPLPVHFAFFSHRPQLYLFEFSFLFHFIVQFFHFFYHKFRFFFYLHHNSSHSSSSFTLPRSSLSSPTL